ncbi:sensor histidine kinase [Undibacterium sp. TJN25]|uniref:sensor histidine kinase n=1 Tax=Undibacterium sp. TJN25 TaxID=3413056 RepID=UPI003BF24175
MNHLTKTKLLELFRSRAFLIKLRNDFITVTAINALCGFMLTYLLRYGGGLLENFVFSMCIGNTAFLLINGGAFLIWGERRVSRPAYYVLCMAAAPVAMYVGVNLGSLIYGYPLRTFTSYHAQFGMGTLIFTLVACLVTTGFFWNRGKMAELTATAEAEKARTAAIEKQAMQAQLQLLQAQIEPHMLFNTLANLQTLIGIDQVRAQHMLDQLIQYLRATLSSSRADQTSLSQEFTLMKAYLELMSIRMGKRLSYTLDLPAELQALKIPPMLLQPLVENAIKHGVEPKMEGGSIVVTARRKDGILLLEVADTGLGLPFDHAERQLNRDAAAGSHLGNANVSDRILAIYGPDASFTLQANQPAGVVARLSLPLAND